MISKEESISQIMTQQNNFYLTLTSALLLNDEEILSTLKGNHVVLGGKYQFNFDVICECLSNAERKVNALSSFVMMSMRHLVKETFEVTQMYAKQNGKYVDMKSQPWFQFARMCRNCLSHTQTFEFNPTDKKFLPVHWNGCCIDIGSEGKYLPETFTVDKVKELVSEFRKFIRQS